MAPPRKGRKCAESMDEDTLRLLSEPRTSSVPKFEKSFLGDNFKDQPLLRRLNYLHVAIIFGAPLLAMYGLLTTPLTWKTLAWSVVYYALTGLGITAGYHRLFAHRAYDAVWSIRLLMAAFGAGAVEGSIRWWSRDHRAHHRYVDTEKDPYAVTRGFWHAHVGWMLVKQDPKKIGRATYVDDLYKDSIIRLQHKFYLPIMLFMGFILPTIVAGLGWGDYRGGFFFAAIARLVFVHHSTFFVNSLAHYLGDSAHSDAHTAKNSLITAVLTLGEGLHNFHHEYPADYRNGFKWYHYDPTKWVIRALSFFGLTYNLKRFPKNEIIKGQLQMIEKSLQQKKRKLFWGPNPKALPEYSWEFIKEQVNLGEDWLVLDGYVLDVKDFIHEHPGGEQFVRSHVGKDATEAFMGGVYKHSNAAMNLQQTLRIARLAKTE